MSPRRLLAQLHNPVGGAPLDSRSREERIIANPARRRQTRAIGRFTGMDPALHNIFAAQRKTRRLATRRALAAADEAARRYGYSSPQAFRARRLVSYAHLASIVGVNADRLFDWGMQALAARQKAAYRARFAAGVLVPVGTDLHYRFDDPARFYDADLTSFRQEIFGDSPPDEPRIIETSTPAAPSGVLAKHDLRRQSDYTLAAPGVSS